MKTPKDLDEWLKKLKSSINKNKPILKNDTLDDVTIIGNPDFIQAPKMLDEQEAEEAKARLRSLVTLEKLAIRPKPIDPAAKQETQKVLLK